ncbi:invasion associated locus B family protein [Futiania mangrovi]|uniref:Invasion associated locus B family protein n=1 Tax=Futiania mangrovi TaxID=2959716 RepID=A0A9J6PKL5_9PROT|nr:invasion associated locus B family protein [Futiania mangrovii]MCP1336610.1 invasion associated locus B family protein [Futiania mangrovii]
MTGRKARSFLGKVLRGALAAGTGLLIAGQAAAAGPELLGNFRDWTAFAMTDGGQKTCWMATKPVEALPDNVRRGDIYLMVTHRPGQSVKNEVSVITGYTYEPGSSVTATVGTDNWSLFTQGDGAWLRDAVEEQRLVEAMKRGANIRVKGRSNRGTDTTDTYSLIGFTAAHKTISEACGVR